MADDLIDFSVLKTLEDISTDDPDFVIRVIHLFIESAPLQLTKVEDSFKQGDATEMGRAAHAMTSNAQNVGATALAALCLKLDHLGRGGKLDNAASLIAELNSTFAQTKILLEQYTSTSKNG